MVDIQWNNPYRPATIDSDGGSLTAICKRGSGLTPGCMDLVHTSAKEHPGKLGCLVGSRGLDDKSNDNNFVDVKFSATPRDGIHVQLGRTCRSIEPDRQDERRRASWTVLDLRRTNYDMIPPRRRASTVLSAAGSAVRLGSSDDHARAGDRSGNRVGRLASGGTFTSENRSASRWPCTYSPRRARELYVEMVNENWNAAIEEWFYL